MKRIDLHRHLEGCLRVQTILDLAREFSVNLPSPTPEGLRPFISVQGQCTGLLDFLNKFRPGAAVLGDLSACSRVARECVEDAAAEELDYLELRFSPAYMAATHRLDLSGVVAAVAEGVASASENTGLPVALIGTLTRTYGPRKAMRELKALLENKNSLCAVDLAGDEAGFPPDLFISHFELVRAAGLHVTIHAGEAAGPESIRVAIERLGAERIGHATRVSEDNSVLELMLERNVGIECCLTSNWQTRALSKLADHPLASWLDAGLRATINTDDPAISQITFSHELEVAQQAAGLRHDQLTLAAAHAESLAFAFPEL